MKRGLGCAVAVLAICLLGTGPASANVPAYEEGKAYVATSHDSVSWLVKPVSGQNNWWWYVNNNLSVNTAICYSFKRGTDIYRNLNGNEYHAPTVGEKFTTMPTADPGTCEGPYTPGTKQPIGKGLPSMTNGEVATFCAEEYYKDVDLGWQNSLDPIRCKTVKVDTTAPSIGVDLRQGGNPVTVTNNPGAVTTRINYSDSISPPWNRGAKWGDNRLCTVTNANCTMANTFNFRVECSDNSSGLLTQSFECPMVVPGSDSSNYVQCYAGFDAAVLDAIPSTLQNNGDATNPNRFLDDNPITNPQTFADGVGNLGIGCDSINVDRAAPNTTITGGPSEGSSSADTTPTFTFTSSEPTGATFQCKFGAGSTYQACSSGYTPTLGGGTYAFYVRAIDAAGNVDASPSIRNFTITAPPDTTPPATSLTATPPATTNDSKPEFSFTSNEPGTFQCAIDSNAFASCSSPHTTTTLGDGPHTFHVYAVDTAGNPDMSPASFSFTVDTGGPPDTTPPDTSITAGPAAGSTINDPTPTFSLASSEGGSTFKCRVDSGAFASCTSPHTTAALTNGAHTFSVQATDATGNSDASPATRSFTVQAGSTPPKDTTAPQTTIRTKPKKTTTSRKAKFTFGSSEAGSTFTCKLDKAPYKSCSSPFSKKVKPGRHKFSVKAKDAAGNTDTSAATFSWKVKKPRR